MLDPKSLDLDELCAALEDHSPDATWWIHTDDGRIRSGGPGGAGWIAIGSVGSHEGYRDMAEFVAGVHHRRAAELLDRAIAGRGAFRRFKDTLFEFPELREQWFRYRDARSRRRALRWLADEGLVERSVAAEWMARYPDPVADEEDVAAAVAVDLGLLYGDRLERVLVFGVWARGEGAEDADIEIVVVLSDLRSRWEELRFMDEVLWRHTERAGLAVVAVPVTAEEWAAPDNPLLRRAAAEAVQLA
jgi:predicted nucleotidyltransferase